MWQVAKAFRKLVDERGVQLRLLGLDELRKLGKSPTEHLTFGSRRATISTIVEEKGDGAIRVVLQGLMNSLFSSSFYVVALDGFYKHADGSVTPMSDKEFYEFD